MKDRIMGIYINTGNDGFQDHTNGEYVDKTSMIAFVNSVYIHYRKNSLQTCSYYS